MDLLSQPQIQIADNHAITGWTDFAAIFAEAGDPGSRASPGTPLGLTADGEAFAPLLAAMHGHTSAQPIEFSADPLVTTGVQALYGWSFGGSAALLNLSGSTATISLPAPLTGLSVQQLTAAPLSRVSGPASVQRNTGLAGATIVLPPYSVTEVG
jgi:hypothetical protein